MHGRACGMAGMEHFGIWSNIFAVAFLAVLLGSRLPIRGKAKPQAAISGADAQACGCEGEHHHGLHQLTKTR